MLYCRSTEWGIDACFRDFFYLFFYLCIYLGHLTGCCFVKAFGGEDVWLFICQVLVLSMSVVF